MIDAPPSVDLDALLARARRASRELPEADRSAGLRAMAEALREDAAAILRANADDLEVERRRGTPAPLLDRLELDPARLDAIAAACEAVSDLPDPLHRVRAGWRSEDGLDVREVTVPFGVIGMIYESRPNVTVDASALAIMAGSAAVLRGSASALSSNAALVTAMRRGLARASLPEDAVQLITSPDRVYVTRLLEARGAVDLVIPRGGASLIAHVVENAKVPTIETGVGNCHVYVHEAADLAKARAIVKNAKVQRPGVCNAVETLLVDAAVAGEFLPAAADELRSAGVDLAGCARARAVVPMREASEEDWGREYLDLVLAVRVVDDLEDALVHVERYGTGHSEAIVTESREAARRFQSRVDAAAVYVNASTRFTDGFMFGFGAEIGISTQKLHARGPMGLAQLVTTKYLVDGDGQIRR